MAKGVKGRVVVVTGAAGGIGAATSELLADAGARVARLDMKWPANTPQDSAEGLVRVLDVVDEAAVARTFLEIANHFGRVDGLATCAGITNTSDFSALDAATFRKVYDVNVVGTFLCVKAAAAQMREGSRIVTVSSVGGIRGGGLFGTAAYAASKGAVIALTKNAARVLGPKGITVNCVAPGPTDTPMNAPIEADSVLKRRLETLVALGRFAAPAEIGQAILWLLSDEASYVNGATLVVDGGLVML
jgi:NAD(P)-dependent dehydrogenase (short-subunit alcohol dehydrogenase family)